MCYTKPNHQNCTSKYFIAITEANFARYEQLLLDGRAEAEYNGYLERWLDAQSLAINHEKSEFNTQTNTKWQRCKNMVNNYGKPLIGKYCVPI